MGFSPWGRVPQGRQHIALNLRLQAHTPQPITASTCAIRKCAWKNNAYISFDWRTMRPFKIGEGKAITPMVEMFNG